MIVAEVMHGRCVLSRCAGDIQTIAEQLHIKEESSPRNMKIAWFVRYGLSAFLETIAASLGA